MKSILCAAIAALLMAMPASGDVGDYVKRPDAWFQSDDAKRIATNVLSWQTSEGGWPKNVDTTAPFTGDRAKLHSSFDNRATTDELRFLARMVEATEDRSYTTLFCAGSITSSKPNTPTGAGRSIRRHRRPPITGTSPSTTARWSN